MATTYTGRAALLIAIFFCFLDITITIFGLAWDGKDFTFDNIGHWWNDFFSPNYDFRTNPIDFLILALIRTTVLLIGGLAVWCNPTTVPGRIQTLSNVHFALMLLIVAFSPTKLLAFAEIDSTTLVNRLAVGDWILMIWSLFAALFVQVIWGSIFTKVKPTDCYLHLPDDSTSRVEAERAAVAKETFELIQRLATYMFKEWPFYIIAFSCLFAYSLARVFIPYYMGEVVAAVMQPEGQAVDYSKLNKCVGVMALLSFLGYALYELHKIIS
uniref:Uncharacterized protein n=1 Tax=Plectus sambesii TaxID=2011161 RepID=A0A914UJ06_9BILA